MELEFYFPKTKSKHKCVPTTGKVYPSKGGTIRYGVQATMNGSKSLPKYITEQEFNRLGFGAESFEATSGSGQISHDPIDVVKQRPAIMRHDHAFTHYDWNTGNYDLTDEQEDELDERIREEITSEPSEGHMDFEIYDVAEDDDGDFITANVDAYTNYGEGRFYGFDAEQKMSKSTTFKGKWETDTTRKIDGVNVTKVLWNKYVVEYKGYLGTLEDANIGEGYWRIRFYGGNKDYLSSWAGDFDGDWDWLWKKYGKNESSRYYYTSKTTYSKEVALDDFKTIVDKFENGDELTRNVFASNDEYLREKEQVAGLDKEERYELYDENKLECDECGAVNKTVGYVEEGYKLCQPCDREMMAKQGYDAEMASLSEIVFEDNVGKKYTTHSDYDHSLINDMVSDEDLVPMDAETIGCPICKGEVHGDMSMIGEEIDYDICGDCDIYIMPQGISCVECGFGDPYGSATPCESCEPIADKMKMVNKNAETVGNPSPSSPLEEVPATVPSPAEPTNENFGAESGQMCEVCFGKDDLPYNSDNFTECKRCGKSVCMDCDGEMQYHPDWFKVCGECSDVLDNVHDYGAESKNTKMVLGITALGIGLAFWKGKDLLSLWDRIKEKMD